jgi:hypothetical protein
MTMGYRTPNRTRTLPWEVLTLRTCALGSTDVCIWSVFLFIIVKQKGSLLGSTSHSQGLCCGAHYSAIIPFPVAPFGGAQLGDLTALFFLPAWGLWLELDESVGLGGELMGLRFWPGRS